MTAMVFGTGNSDDFNCIGDDDDDDDDVKDYNENQATIIMTDYNITITNSIGNKKNSGGYFLKHHA